MAASLLLQLSIEFLAAMLIVAVSVYPIGGLGPATSSRIYAVTTPFCICNFIFPTMPIFQAVNLEVSIQFDVWIISPLMIPCNIT